MEDQSKTVTAEIVVVGAGPAGSCAATWAARAGRDVLLLDSATFPRDKTCGDGLTPRAIVELQRLGLEEWIAGFPRTRGVHMFGWGTDGSVPWSPGAFPDYGSVVPRSIFDEKLRRLAIDEGVTMMEGAKVVAVDAEGGQVRSLRVAGADGEFTVVADQVLVADGVRSPVGKMLGREWHRTTVYGVAMRSYMRIAEPNDWLDTHFGLRHATGEALPGYGWMFPLGESPGSGSFETEGQLVNIGVAAYATESRPAGVQLRLLLTEFTESIRDRFGLIGEPMDAKSALLPLGGAVSTVAGKNWMLIGDAAGLVNPMTGEGIDYAMESGRLAAEMLSEADHTHSWPARLIAEYGQMFSATRRITKLFFHPKVAAAIGGPVLRWPKGKRGVMRLMTNLVHETDRDSTAVMARAGGWASLKIDSRPPFSQD